MDKPYRNNGNESHISELPYRLLPEIAPLGTVTVPDPDRGDSSDKPGQDTTDNTARVRGWSKQNKLG